MKILEMSSVLRLDDRRFLKAPGPRSKRIFPSITKHGQARFALTAEPPDPKTVSFNAWSSSVSSLFAVRFSWVFVGEDRLAG